MSSAAGDRTPALSIVIPTCRRSPLLRRALDRLEGQADDRIEVLVVDDAGDDPTGVARAVDASERPYPVRCPDHAPAGAAAARNAGWRAARAPLVLFLGDDILVDAGLVDGHLRAHARWPEDEVAVLGHVRWADELKVTPFMRFLDEGVQYDYANMQAGDVGWGRLYTSNVSFKRELVARVDGFDESFTIPYEDLELGRRLHDHGLQLMYEPSIRAEHLHPATPDGWRPRMAATARAERAMAAKHPDFAPYFRDALAYWRGRRAPGVARLVDRVPASTPFLGPRVHAAARERWKITLADAFFAAWDEDAPA